MPSRSSPASSTGNGRAKSGAASARSELIQMLKDDHKRVKKAYKEFEKLQGSGDTAGCERIVRQVLSELSVHASLEEELLYPACKEALDDTDLVLEAEVEHESARQLMDQLRLMSPSDEKYAARFTVLCEYVMHHVQEEEGELFPKLTRAKIDWTSMLASATERRETLMASEGMSLGADDGEDPAAMAAAAPVRVRSARGQNAARGGRGAAR